MDGQNIAESWQDAADHLRAQRVLVAEDSSAVQDLLALVLGQRGLEVDIVSDGEAALEALRAKPFDVALLDFNMPKMNGLEVLAAFQNGEQDETCPHFVAITGDVEGLLASPDNCEQFDRVLPKPLDISTIANLIDELGAAKPIGLVPRASHAVETSSDATDLPRPSSIEALGYRFLRWPADSDRRRLALGAGGYDAVLVYDLPEPRDLAHLWEASGLHLLPVIDLTGKLGASADLDASTLAVDRAQHVSDLIDGFADRRATLHADLQRAETLEDRLLGRIHVAGADLIPRLDGDQRELISFNAVGDPVRLARTAQKLVEQDLLSPTFSDRLHHCSACASARLVVREECPECKSAQLEEQSYLHHFRCAYQGPESDFRKGDDLICPKCRRELRHFGRDYDRPGQLVVCNDCGHSTSEPSVGFVCVDCSARSDGDTIGTHDVYSYRVTDQGQGYLEAGSAYLGLAQSTLRFTDLPLELVVALNAEAKRFNDTGATFSLLNIAYENAREITRTNGARQFAQVRKLFLEQLSQTLGAKAKIVQGQGYDYALLPSAAPEVLTVRAEEICRKAAAGLRVDPGATISCFGPQDLA